MLTSEANATPPTVLIVDDAPENIDILKAALGDAYQIRPAISGPLALRIAAATPTPDIILLDLLMPGMDGNAVLKQLRANPLTAEIPVIYITAVDSRDAELRGLELGAVDYITKPFVGAVVRAKVQTHIAFRRARQALELHNQRLLSEKVLIEDIIDCLRRAPEFDDRHLRAVTSSLENANGDTLLAAFTPDRRQLVLVGDVAGHGIPAAVCAPLIAHIFYRLVGAGADLVAVRDEIDRVLREKLPTYIYLAACLIEVAADRRAVKLWNAGMPAPLLVSPGKPTREIVNIHPPLGVTLAAPPSQAPDELTSEADDRLYVFSDGLSEVSAPDGRRFGGAELRHFVETLDGTDEALNGLVATLQRFQGHDALPDDLTLVELDFAPARPAHGSKQP